MTREVDGHDVFYFLAKLSTDLRKSNETSTDGDIFADEVDNIIKAFTSIPETKCQEVFKYPEKKMLEYFQDIEAQWECRLCGESFGDYRDMFRHLATHSKEEIEKFEVDEN